LGEKKKGRTFTLYWANHGSSYPLKSHLWLTTLRGEANYTQPGKRCENKTGREGCLLIRETMPDDEAFKRNRQSGRNGREDRQKPLLSREKKNGIPLLSLRQAAKNLH